ncbi:hypothetical protein AB0G15_12680 [Streptosporangium sp. NPDC023825]|uniref:hypothetical protein n=1 Tax=Streptosporangium sp. NPDC023825 TaxID=3154909 RepID=UPI00341B718E
MAGTLMYEIESFHTYQRRFDSKSLEIALRNCHWYIISRRPAIRIIGAETAPRGSIVNIKMQTRNSISEPLLTIPMRMRAAPGSSFSDFQIHADGAYFYVEIGNHPLHGDSWALASFLSNAADELARHEVLYVGQAFGKDGTRNAWGRTQEHSKLQRIYEDHASSGWDIFVTPLRLLQHLIDSDDHIDDDEDGFDLDEYQKSFGFEGLQKPSVDLIEHSLISYFSPHYNDLLKTWKAGSPTEAMRAMRGAGFRLLQVHLNGWMDLTRFYSSSVPSRVRSHFISQDIPPEPRRPVLSGISAVKISDWRLNAQFIRRWPTLLAGAAEVSGVELKIFGKEAPANRVPPEVAL